MPRAVQKISFPAQMPRALRVAAYARVSTGKDAMLHSLAAQVDYYRSYICRHPGWEYAGVYADEAMTGTKDSRGNFQRLLADCRAGMIDRVIVKSIARLARNTVTLLETVRELKHLGISVYFEEQNIDTATAEGELIMTILASYAQEESRSASENTKWRVRQKFEEGKPWNCTILGYRWDGQKLVIIPEEAEVVRSVFSDYLSGKGYQAIANDLNARAIPSRYGSRWSLATVERLLSAYVYAGNLMLQRTFSENHLTKKKLINTGQLPKYHVQESHEAIIDTATFQAVQEEKKRRAWAQRPKHTIAKTSPFTSLLVCDHCGKHYKRKTVRGKPVWICSTYNKCGKAACPAKQIPEDILAAAIPDTALLDHVQVCDENRLVLHFRDGPTEVVTWADRSRTESWTPEMREKAALDGRRRCSHG